MKKTCKTDGFLCAISKLFLMGWHFFQMLAQDVSIVTLMKSGRLLRTGKVIFRSHITQHISHISLSSDEDKLGQKTTSYDHTSDRCIVLKVGEGGEGRRDNGSRAAGDRVVISPLEVIEQMRGCSLFLCRVCVSMSVCVCCLLYTSPSPRDS